MRLKIILAVLIAFSFAPSVYADSKIANQSFVDAITKSQSALKKINGPKKICDQTSITENKLGSVKSLNGKEFEISVVDLKTAQTLFDEMAAKEHIPFRYPEDGCYARAHEMSRLLEEKGIITGKVFLEGDLRVETKNSPKGYVEWWYHVAPIVLVEVDGKREPYVIDPSIFQKPVPAEEWFAIQTKHASGKRSRTYQTPRFNYTPSSSTSDGMTAYKESDLVNMRETMTRYLAVQKERDKNK